MCPTTIVMQLLLQMNGGREEMLINNFTSTWLVNNYVFMEKLAAHIRASHFSQDIEDDILDSTRRVLQYINKRGGFRIIGWAKRGMIRDQGAAIQNKKKASEGGMGSRRTKQTTTTWSKTLKCDTILWGLIQASRKILTSKNWMPSSTPWEREETEMNWFE